MEQSEEDEPSDQELGAIELAELNDSSGSPPDEIVVVEKDSFFVKFIICVITITFGSLFPIALKNTRIDGKYEFHPSVAILLKNSFQLLFYIGLWFVTDWRADKNRRYEFLEEEAISPTSEEIDAFRQKLRTSIWLLPNALLVVGSDLLAFLTLTYISVSTYALFMQTTLIFIVIVRTVVFKKETSISQYFSILIVVIGMIIFKSEENRAADGVDDDQWFREMIGITLCLVRGLMKAADLVYVEWFLHYLDGLTFSEKQIFVSIWFVLTSIIIVIIETRFGTLGIFVGITNEVMLYVFCGVSLGVCVYLLINRLNSLVMGFCQQFTVITTVVLDHFMFETAVSVTMWQSSALVVLGASQYNVIGHERKKLQNLKAEPECHH